MCNCLDGLNTTETTSEYATNCLQCLPGREREISYLETRTRLYDKAVDKLDTEKLTPWRRTLRRQLRQAALDCQLERRRLLDLNGALG